MPLNIVELIEKSPITKLSNTYNNKLLTKIKESFTESQQQLFISSFYCYLNFDSRTDFVIDLDDVWRWLGFYQKDTAKTLIEKNFTLDVNYKMIASGTPEAKKGRRGGHNIKKFMLNISTFKLLCIKADTKKASEIHEYFVKLEELLQTVILEESQEIRQQLEQQKTELQEKTNELLTTQREFDAKLIEEKQLEKHQVLLREFGTIGRPLVYIIKVKSYDNGNYIIKIGETRVGVESRYMDHKTHFGNEIVLLDCFLVCKSKEFESFLHEHYRNNRVTDLPGHESARELFLVSGNLTYASIKKTIEKNIKQFNDYNETELEKLRLENEQLHIKNNAKNQLDAREDIKKIMIMQVELQQTLKIILDKLSYTQIRTTTNFGEPLVTVGPRLQKINPETMQLVKVYESVSECMKEDSRMKRPSINKAIAESTIYNGFRWATVERDLDPNVIRGLQPTKLTRTQILGYVAKLNADKSEILNVYLDRKTASVCNEFPSSSSLDTPVKNYALARGHYYAVYETCDEELRRRFEIKNNGNPPLLYENGVGQYDGNHNIVKEFKCKYECIRQLTMSGKTLAKALDKGLLYNGHYFKSLEKKVKSF